MIAELLADDDAGTTGVSPGIGGADRRPARRYESTQGEAFSAYQACRW